MRNSRTVFRKVAFLGALASGCGSSPSSKTAVEPAAPAVAPASTSICDVPGRPEWVCDAPEATAEWRYGVGSGETRDAAYEAAVTKLAQSIGIEITGRTLREFTELANGDHTELRDEWRRRSVAAWKQTVRDVVVMGPYWQAPDRRWWVRVRAPAKHILTRRVEAAAEEMATQLKAKLPVRARVLVIPAFELSGITHALGAVLADRLGAGLLARGISADTVRRPAVAGDLDALLRQYDADVLIYGTVYGDVEPIAVMFEAVRPPGLSEKLAVVPMDLPSDAYVQSLRMASPTPVPDFLKAKIMGLGSGPVAVEAVVEPAAPVEGQPIVIRVRSPLAGYLTVLNVSTDGGVTRVLPRRPDRPTRVEPGQWFEIPGDVAGVEGETLLAELPRIPGPERLMIVVTERPDALPPLKFPDAVSGAVTERHAHGDLLRALWALEGSAERWGARALTFTIRGR